MKRPEPPAGLGVSGRELWKAVIADLPDTLEYEGRELALLHEAAKLADDLTLVEAGIKEHGAVTLGASGQVRANPLIAEARQTRLAIGRLLAQLKIIEPAQEKRSTRDARRAALARWHGPRAQAAKP